MVVLDFSVFINSKGSPGRKVGILNHFNERSVLEFGEIRLDDLLCNQDRLMLGFTEDCRFAPWRAASLCLRGPVDRKN